VQQFYGTQIARTLRSHSSHKGKDTGPFSRIGQLVGRKSHLQEEQYRIKSTVFWDVTQKFTDEMKEYNVSIFRVEKWDRAQLISSPDDAVHVRL
jgi:hypothetical protein